MHGALQPHSSNRMHDDDIHNRLDTEIRKIVQCKMPEKDKYAMYQSTIYRCCPALKDEHMKEHQKEVKRSTITGEHGEPPGIKPVLNHSRTENEKRAEKARVKRPSHEIVEKHIKKPRLLEQWIAY